jgi:DNA-binding response OmpR family regulator
MIAYDGENAAQILAESNFKPDFVLLDLNLPKFSGLQLLERFNGDDPIPFIVLTSSVNPQDRERALALGAIEYVVKPANFEEFMQTVCGILERWTLGSSRATNAGE